MRDYIFFFVLHDIDEERERDEQCEVLETLLRRSGESEPEEVADGTLRGHFGVPKVDEKRGVQRIVNSSIIF